MRTIAVINYQSYWRILTSYSQAGQCPLAWGIWRSKPTRVKPPGEMTKIPRAGKAFPCTPLSAYINIISLPLGLKTALCKLCISTAWPFPAPPRRHFLGSSEHDLMRFYVYVEFSRYISSSLLSLKSFSRVTVCFICFRSHFGRLSAL